MKTIKSNNKKLPSKKTTHFKTLSQVKKQKKSTSKKKKRSLSVQPLKDRSSLSLGNQISDLVEEIKLKDDIIKKYQTQLSLANDVMIQLTHKVDDDLRKLNHLHENLIPTKFPTIDKCEFSYKFISSAFGEGKDFYQMIPLLNMHFGLVMSSCASHILSSLLFTSRLNLMKRVDYKTLQPNDVLKNLIEDICYQTKKKTVRKQIDLFYAIVNQKKYQLSYCNVGQIKAFLYSVSTKEVKQLKTHASDFSFSKNQKLLNSKINLQSKDHLVICSPGVVGAKNVSNELFGTDRIQSILQDLKTVNAHSIRNRMMHELKKFTSYQSLHRDQSIMVMEVRGNILKLA